MNNHHNLFIPYCIVWILLSHMSFDICFWVNIGPTTQLSISYYSYYESLSSQNSQRLALAQKILIITTIFFPHIVKYGYSCPIESLVFLWMNIYQATLISISHYSDFVSRWKKIVANGSISINTNHVHISHLSCCIVWI